MIKPADIKSPFWQLSLTEPGSVVQAEDELRQALILILTTTAGTVPLEPFFGVGIPSYLDLPASQLVSKVKQEITKKVAIYEPRIKISSVIVKQLAAEQVQVIVGWQPAGSPDQFNTEVNYG